MDTTFAISADRLVIGGVAARYVASPNTGGRMHPAGIVVHDTAGALRPFSSVEWFCEPACQTSAHAVIERDGTVTQMVPFDVKAWHAGKKNSRGDRTEWHGRPYCNAWMIGIELVNPGRLHRVGDVCVADFTGPAGRFDVADCVEIDSADHNGRYWWLPYTPEQIEAVTALSVALAQAYPAIKDIIGHWQVSPGYKCDPGPQFPWTEFLADVDARMQAQAEPVELSGNCHDLALGASGPQVEAAQTRLAGLGFMPGSIDGQFGPRMRAAVLAFEAENGLTTDGVLDAADTAALYAETAKSMPARATEEATAADLRDAGSGTMADGGAVKTVGKIAFNVAAGEATGQAAFGVSPIETGLSFAERGLNMASRIGLGKSFHLRASHVVVLALVILGVWLWRRGGAIEWRRLLEHRSGKNLNR